MIEQYGWSDMLRLAFEPHRRAGLLPGRIMVQQREAHTVVTDDGNLSARVSGRVRHEAREAGHPVAGDWVALSVKAGAGMATIHAILPRRTAFVRRAADSVQTLQVIAANIDVVFVVTSMNADLNPRIGVDWCTAGALQHDARHFSGQPVSHRGQCRFAHRCRHGSALRQNKAPGQGERVALGVLDPVHIAVEQQLVVPRWF